MKILLTFAFLTFASCEFKIGEFDWTSIKPLSQIKEYREAFPHIVVGEFLNNDVRIFNHRDGRIIRGEHASPTDFPYMVGLILSFASDNGWCGGTLLSKKYVLTAGSCLVSNPQVTALLGASDILKIDQIISAEIYKVHESFTKNLENDIGLIRLARDATLNSEVALTRLPGLSQTSDMFEDRSTSAAGWGYTGKANDVIPTPYLQVVRAVVISHSSCVLRFPAYVTRNNICTSVPIGTPCDGDEGGALSIIDDDRLRTQVGIFSYQFSLGCDRGWPAVFTRASAYLNWIEENSDAVLRS